MHPYTTRAFRGGASRRPLNRPQLGCSVIGSPARLQAPLPFLTVRRLAILQMSFRNPIPVTCANLSPERVTQLDLLGRIGALSNRVQRETPIWKGSQR